MTIMRHKTRPYLDHGRFYLLRDVLSYSPRKSPPLNIHTVDVENDIIEERLKTLNPEAVKRKGETIEDKPLANTIVRGFGDLRRIWEQVKKEFPKEFMERLKRIQRPTPTSAIACICFTTLRKLPDIRNTHDLIPWDKLTLAGIPCRDFTIRKARRNQLRTEVIIPNWKNWCIFVGFSLRAY
jgi:hypothetical protein